MCSIFKLNTGCSRVETDTECGVLDKSQGQRGLLADSIMHLPTYHHHQSPATAAQHNISIKHQHWMIFKMAAYCRPIASANIPQAVWVNSIRRLERKYYQNHLSRIISAVCHPTFAVLTLIIFEKGGAQVYGDIPVRRGLITRVYWDTGFKRGFWLCLSLITRVEGGGLRAYHTVDRNTTLWILV